MIEQELIEQELLSNATKYSFIEVYKLLCELAISNKLDPMQVVRIRPVLGLQHARTQVVSVTKQQDPQLPLLYFLNVNLPGLYGSASPLPKFFTEELVQASHKDQNQTRVFLDLIHQRLYQLLFAATTQPLPHYGKNGSKNMYDFMFSMVGFKDDIWLQNFPDPAFILRNINTIRHQKGTVVGLRNLVQNIFSKAQVDIEQCVARQVDISSSQQLGLNKQANQVSFSAVLGGKTEDTQSKIILSIAPLTVKEYKKWFLTPKYWSALQNLIRYFVGQALLVDLRINVITDDSMELELLADDQFALGRNAWLSQEDKQKFIIAPLTL
jgi:type VI secretion system protein ImpH